jgi:predicted ATPase/DNA-binding CsgD family transcriptional regulator
VHQGRSHNLPHQLTSFVGRDAQLAELSRLVAERQLVTLTGLAGSGKTRLALQVASAMLDRFADGVWLVEFGSLTESALVPQALATTLEVAEKPRQPLVHTVVDSLRDKHVLLVLDNCEHLLEACAELSRALLGECAQVHLLTTSREPLSQSGEFVVQVATLSIPAGDRSPLVERVLGSEAGRLFVERAEANSHAFRLTAENALSVARICRRLDGIPLAIELAAAWVGPLGVAQIAQRLNDPLRLLTRGNRGVPDRHRTLRACIDWSFNLLTPREQTLFCCLSVFAGGWSLEAAEAVCEADASATANFLDLLSRLVDKSLVTAEPDSDGTMRYRVLQVLREYGRQRLEDEHDPSPIYDRHADYFLAVAELARADLRGDRQLFRLQQLERDHDNVRAALGWCAAERESARGLRLAAALGTFWELRGYISEGRRWLAAALQADDTPSSVRAEANQRAGTLAERQHDLAAALAYFQEAMRWYQANNDLRGFAATLNSLAGIARWNGNPKALEYYEASLAASRKLDDPRLIGAALVNLGGLKAQRGDLAQAATALREAEGLFRAQGIRDGLGFTLFRLGELGCVQGEYVAARAYAEEAVACLRALGYTYGIVVALGGLGRVAQMVGDLPRAWAAYEEALALASEVGATRHAAYALLHLGEISLYEGDADTARTLMEQSSAQYQEIGDRWGLMATAGGRARVALLQRDLPQAQELFTDCLERLRRYGWDQREIPVHVEAAAALIGASGHPDKAALLLGAAAAARDNVGPPRPPVEAPAYERSVEQARASTGSDRFSMAWAQGHAMTVSEALDFALEALTLPPQPQPRRHSGLGGLTHREREVIQLIVRGHSNREIADTLVIASSTAERHVANILAKLSLRSRTETAVWAVEHPT